MRVLLCLAVIASWHTSNVPYVFGTIDFEDGNGHNVPIPQGFYPGLEIENAVWISYHRNGPFMEGIFGLGVDGGLHPTEGWGFPGTTEPITIRFLTSVTSVTIEAWDVGSNGAMLTGFDSLGNVLQVDSYIGSGFGGGNGQPLMIHADGIAYVELTQPEFHERSQDAVGWDNLQFISEDRLFFQDVQIDPRTTYLRTISDPPVNFRPPNDFVYVDSDRVARHVDSEALELRTLIPGKTIEPGDYLLLESVGEYCFTNPICENTIGGLWGVFSGSGVLLQDEDASIQNRVPDQLSVQAGTFSLVETPVNGGLPSDIESDFWIRSPGDSSRTVVQVPEGATHLFVSAADEVWFENWLPLGSEFGLRVTLYPDSSADGDVDGNGTVDVADIDTMSRQVRSGEFSVAFDLTHDGRVDVNDRIVLIKDRINTWVGDSNLDGEFNTGDLIAVFQAGLFETGNPAGWLQGDWDGNGVFDTGDIIYAFQDGGYEQGPQSAAVPEPVGFVTLMWSAVVVAVVRRKKACGFTAGKVGEE